VEALLQVFGEADIVFHPFFLTRLAGYWSKGEKFAEATASKDQNRLTRERYVIELFVNRESREKWIDIHDNPLLSDEQHKELMSVVAEEMWRTGATHLSEEELAATAEIALEEMKAPRAVWQDVQKRISTHATLVPRQRQFGFIHTQFFNYYLGYRLERLLHMGRVDDLVALLQDKDLSPDAADWSSFHAAESRHALGDIVGVLQRLVDSPHAVTTIRSNVGTIASYLLDRLRGPQVALRHCTFVGDVLRGRRIEGTSFRDCSFWHCELSGTQLTKSTFERCVFADFVLDATTGLTDCKFIDCTFERLQTTDDRLLFVPDAIRHELSTHGAQFADTSANPQAPEQAISVDEKVIDITNRLVRQSIRSCDVAVEEFEESHDWQGKEVIKIGLNAGVLDYNDKKKVSGGRKTFVRFTVDREQLMSAYPNPPKGTVVERFWLDLERKFPAKKS
jgi:hypothetical protein